MPRLLKAWKVKYDKVEYVENKWDDTTINENNSFEFIKDVFDAYRPGPRNTSQVFNENHPADVAYCLNESFREAFVAHNLKRALAIIIRPRQNGGIYGLNMSYGSKCLRLRCPEGYVIVFDNVMSRVTQYPISRGQTPQAIIEDINSYYEYIRDCRILQAELKTHYGKHWRLCDIEAALYWYFNSVNENF